MKMRIPLLCVWLLLIGSNSNAAEEYQYDPENGLDINEVCAGCHGE